MHVVVVAKEIFRQSTDEQRRADGGTEVSAAVDPSLKNSQLTVGELRL